VSLSVAAVYGVDSLGLFSSDVSQATAPAIASSVAPASAVAVSPVQDVADLYDQLRPSVVKITVTSASSGGTGSGVVLDSQGNILTNEHVVSGSTQISVKLYDGTNASAIVVGSDAGDDLAVLKIDVPADKLKPAKLGDADRVRVGQLVVAIGNPLELEATLTEGVVSGLGRVLNDGNGRPLRQMIQTDAAINPGNSGGGLFNLSGELVGITNALENPAGENAFAGIGYAIPLSTVQRFLPDMLAGKAISHPKLAGALEDLNPVIANSIGTNAQQGVVIAQVDANSGASRAGLRRGDVIIAIDGREVKDYNDLGAYLDTKKAGDKVEVKIVRVRSEQTISITLDAWVHS
jgi:S1-C subfamily serine protease